MELCECPELNLLDFCLCGWMMDEVYKLKVVTPDELLACVLDAACRINEREDQLRRTTRHLHTRVTKCAGFDGGIFERLTFWHRNYFLNFSTPCV